MPGQVKNRRIERPSPRALLIAVRIATIIALCYPILEPAVAENDAPEMPSAAGLHDLVFTTEAAQAMRYSLSLPASTPRNGTQPLVLALHYGGQATGFYGRALIEQLIQPALADLEAVIVAPVTLGGDWSNVDNERALMELLTDLEQTYATDPARRLITGYSMGGAGTWHMLARQPDRFSAAIPISGFKNIEAGSCKTPVYALHSRADSIFDAEALSELIASLAAAGCEAQVEFVDGVDHYNIPAFAPLLEKTVPWLRDLWAR